MRACRKLISERSHEPSRGNQGRTTFFRDDSRADRLRGAPMSLLSIQRLEGGYGRLTVFRDVSLELERDQTVGLLGANGAGKTTLMKTIVGALPSNSGSVLLHGKDLSQLPAYQRARKGLGLVPEGRHILATLTVRDNLELSRAIEGHPPD